MKIRILIFVSIILLSGCTNESPLTPDQEQVVLRGYIYADQPVDDIQLSTTLILGDEDTIAPPVNDADVVLMKNGTSYQMISSSGDSGYYHYPGHDLKVETGDEYQIKVVVNEQILIAETVVPPPPMEINLSRTQVEYIDMWELRQSGIDMEEMRELMSIEVTWKGEEDAMYYVIVENIETSPEEVNSEYAGMRPPFFMSRPTTETDYRVTINSLTHYGTHKVTVYRINEEYADLYQSRNQDSRDLNEPASNVVGGLGVFSAFNSISQTFKYVPQTEG